VSRTEVFQHVESFAEVGFNRSFDDLTGRFGHKGPHTGQLLNLIYAAPGSRITHDKHRIQVRLSVPNVIFKFFHHFAGHFDAGMRPGIDNLVVTLALSQSTVSKVMLHPIDPFLGFARVACLNPRFFILSSKSMVAWRPAISKQSLITWLTPLEPMAKL